jgi:hypothetical protein
MLDQLNTHSDADRPITQQPAAVSNSNAGGFQPLGRDDQVKPAGLTDDRQALNTDVAPRPFNPVNPSEELQKNSTDMDRPNADAISGSDRPTAFRLKPFETGSSMDVKSDRPDTTFFDAGDVRPELPSAGVVAESESGFEPKNQTGRHDNRVNSGSADAASDSEPAQSRDAVYKTLQDEPLWDIAFRCYGDGRLFRALFEHNRAALQGLEILPQGTEIRCPPIEDLFLKYEAWIPEDFKQPLDGNPDAASRNYVVGEGDSLFSIAREQLGQASRYVEIWERNRERLRSGIDAMTILPAGTVLELPDR